MQNTAQIKKTLQDMTNSCGWSQSRVLTAVDNLCKDKKIDEDAWWTLRIATVRSCR